MPKYISSTLTDLLTHDTYQHIYDILTEHKRAALFELFAEPSSVVMWYAIAMEPHLQRVELESRTRLKTVFGTHDATIQHCVLTLKANTPHRTSPHLKSQRTF